MTLPKWIEEIKERREAMNAFRPEIRKEDQGYVAGCYKTLIEAGFIHEYSVVYSNSLLDIPALLATIEKYREALELITTLTRPSPPTTVGLLESRSVSPASAYRLGKYNAAVIAQEALNFIPEGRE